MSRPTVDNKRSRLWAKQKDFLVKEGLFEEYADPGAVDLHGGGLLILACPGCGKVSGMTVGDPKPDNGNGATWLMTGDFPNGLTLQPSINCVGCCGWHGYLTNGVFNSV